MKRIGKQVGMTLLAWGLAMNAWGAVGGQKQQIKSLWEELRTTTDLVRQQEIKLELNTLLENGDRPVEPGHLDQGGDNCLEATSLVGWPLPLSVFGTTLGYMNNVSALGLGPLTPECWNGYYSENLSCSGPDVYYVFAAPNTASYRFSLCGSSYDTGLLIYNYTCPAEPTNPVDFLCGNDDFCNLQSEVSAVPLFAGQQVLIVVDGWNNNSGNYELQISENFGTLPNDECFSAIDMPINSMITGSTIGALVDAAPFCGTSISAGGVWYSVMGTGNPFTATTCPNVSYDTKLNVYSDCPPFGCIGGNDDACNGVGSEVSWVSLPGQPYFILVQGFNGQTGSFDLTVTEEVPCAFPEFTAIATMALSNPVPFVLGTEVVNAVFEPMGPYSFQGRSLAVGEMAPEALYVRIRKLNEYKANGFLPEEIMRPFLHELPWMYTSFTIIERVLGAVDESRLLPEALDDAGDPLVVLNSPQGGHFKVVTLEDNLVGGPYTFPSTGVPPGEEMHMAMDNDELNLHVLSDIDIAFGSYFWQLAIVHLPLNDAAGDLPQLISPVVSLAGIIGNREVLDADYVEGANTLLVLADTPREALHIDLSNPLAPALISSCIIDPTIWGLSASDGFCSHTAGTGQWVALRDDFGLPMICTTPCAPSPIPIPYPIAGTYLEPNYGFSLAVDQSETIQGRVEISPWIEGPWVPDNVAGLYSYDSVIWTMFDMDTSGIGVGEITFGDSPTLGDGWRLEFDPPNETVDSIYITVCYDNPFTGEFRYETIKVAVQDLIQPDIDDPDGDGKPVPPDGTGEVEQPDEGEVAGTEVERREVTNPPSDDIEPIPQVRDGLPGWKYPDSDEPIPGGAHCAPTAAIQQIIALARDNDCLNRMINCFLGNGDVISTGFTDDEITKLIKWMGKFMETNKHECGSPYEKAAKGVEDFIKYIKEFAETECDIICDPKIYAHMIKIGDRGDDLDWGDVMDEFEEKNQTISLRVSHGTPPDARDHRVSIKSIVVRPDGKMEVTIADPADGEERTMVIDPSTKPPTIVDDGNEFEEWEKITGAIAISDTTPPPDDGLRRGRTLDNEYHVWESVLSVNGPITQFSYDDLTPGFWKYRVRVYTAAGDSATDYRTVYVPEPLNLTAQRVANDLVLRWDPEPWAIHYVVQVAPTPTGPWLNLAMTPLTTLTTAYNDADTKHYRVITVFGE